jgi:hypothetical protein
LLAPYVSIQDTLVARALKNSQLTCGETYAYFGDRTPDSELETVRAVDKSEFRRSILNSCNS